MCKVEKKGVRNNNNKNACCLKANSTEEELAEVGGMMQKCRHEYQRERRLERSPVEELDLQRHKSPPRPCPPLDIGRKCGLNLRGKRETNKQSWCSF